MKRILLPAMLALLFLLPAPIRDAISRAIDDMKADGSLREILGDLRPPGKRDAQRSGGPVCQ